MNHEYFLIGYRHRVTLKGYYVLDRVVSQSLKEAEKEFKYMLNNETGQIWK